MLNNHNISLQQGLDFYKTLSQHLEASINSLGRLSFTHKIEELKNDYAGRIAFVKNCVCDIESFSDAITRDHSDLKKIRYILTAIKVRIILEERAYFKYYELSPFSETTPGRLIIKGLEELYKEFFKKNDHT